jgi:hypothetical protein
MSLLTILIIVMLYGQDVEAQGVRAGSLATMAALPIY